MWAYFDVLNDFLEIVFSCYVTLCQTGNNIMKNPNTNNKIMTVINNSGTTDKDFNECMCVCMGLCCQLGWFKMYMYKLMYAHLNCIAQWEIYLPICHFYLLMLIWPRSQYKQCLASKKIPSHLALSNQCPPRGYHFADDCTVLHCLNMPQLIYLFYW